MALELKRTSFVRDRQIEWPATLAYLDAAVDYKASAAPAREAGLAPHPDPAIAAIQRGAAVRSPEYAGYARRR